MKQLLQTGEVSYVEDDPDAKDGCLSLLRSGKRDAVNALISSLPNSAQMHRIMLELSVEHSLFGMAEYLAQDRRFRLDYDNGRVFHLAVDGKKWDILAMLSRVITCKRQQ